MAEAELPASVLAPAGDVAEIGEGAGVSGSGAHGAEEVGARDELGAACRPRVAEAELSVIVFSPAVNGVEGDGAGVGVTDGDLEDGGARRSEEHTSELQSRENL